MTIDIDIEVGSAAVEAAGRGLGNRADYRFGTAEGWDGFRVVRWHAVEQLSRPFSYKLTLARDAALGPANLQALVDASATFAIRHEGGIRPVHGIVGMVEEIERTRRLYLYRVELVPHIVRARHRGACRSSRKRGVIDAITRLLENSAGVAGGLVARAATTPIGSLSFDAYHEPIAGYRWSLVDPESARLADPEYRSTIIQYNESDFDLLSRLLEEEGLTYHFEHTLEGSTVVLSDHPGAVPAYGSTLELEMRAPGFGTELRRERVHALRERFDLRPCAARVVEQDRMVPRLRLEGRFDGLSVQATGDRGRFACPGGPLFCELFSRFDMERHEAQRALANGMGDVRALEPGIRAVLRDGDALYDDRDVVFERVEAYGQELLPEGTALDREPFGFDGRPSREPFYENHFRALRSEWRYRPELTIAKPRMSGVHRAIVTHEEGAAPNPEINTNPNGDVRIRFSWDDRLPELGIASSRWVPVVNYWAGTGWGSHQTPRVGQTVYVGFHDGDPDQPVVLGGYYSMQTPPAYDPSQQPTVSSMRTQSSPGGGGFNEISFDDSAGNEMFSTTAQKDASHSVGNNYSQDVGGDSSSGITGDNSTAVQGGQSGSVGGPDVQTCDDDACHVVAGDYLLSAGGTLMLTADSVDITGTSDVTITAPSIRLGTGPGGESGATLLLEGSNATLKAKGLLTIDGMTVLVTGEAVVAINVGGSVITLSVAAIRQVASMIELNPEG